MFLKAHKKDTLAVQDLQAPDGLSLTFWQEFNFLEQAAAWSLVHRGKHFLNSAIVCKGKKKMS